MYTAILLLPLLGAVIAGFFHRQIGEWMAMVVSTGLLFLCAVLSWVAFFTYQPGDPSIELFRWIASGESGPPRLNSTTAVRVIAASSRAPHISLSAATSAAT